MLNDVAAEIAKGKNINVLDLTSCFNTYQRLGNDLGNSGRLILEFNPSAIPALQTPTPLQSTFLNE